MKNLDCSAHPQSAITDLADAPGCNEQGTEHQALVETELVLIRGLPGSGKSTMAGVLASVGYAHFEADMFFMVDGTYRYDASRIREAHAWCQQMTRKMLERGQRVVVSNTFTRLSELAPYLSMTLNVRVIEAQGRWANVHDVPPVTIRRMAERWERYMP
jgi:cytidylate kinase